MIRILYVEDNPLDAELTQRELARRSPDYHIDSASTLREARALLTAGASYDLILLNLHLSDGSGLELVGDIRQQIQPSAVVVLISPEDEAAVAAALKAGVDDYLVKNANYLLKLPGSVENVFHRVQLERELSALRENEARYRRLAENAQVMIYHYRLSPTPGFEYVNSASTAITGYTPEDLYADPERGLKIIHPDDRYLLEQSVGGESHKFTIVLRWIRKDGTVIWVERHTVPIYDDEGNLIALEGVARDITEKKRTEDQLREREEGFRLLFESNPHPMWVYDMETLKFLEVNDAAVEHYGYSREEFLSMSLPDIRPPEDVPRLLNVLQSDYPPWHHFGEWRHRLKSGEIINIEITSHRLDFAGREAGLVVAQDITKRHQAEEARHSSEEKYRQIVETTLEGIWVIDAEDRTIFVNDRMAEMLGYTVDEMLGRSLLAFVDDEARSLITATIDGREQGLHELVCRCKDGTPLWTLISMNPLFDKHGQYGGLQAMVTDISDLKQIQQAEREQRRLVEALAGTANALIVTVDLYTMMDTLLEGVARVVPHDAANVMLIEDNLAHAVYWRGYPPEYDTYLRDFRFSVSDTPSFRTMFETGSPLLVSDTGQFADWVRQSKEWVKSYVAAPIRSHGKVIGFLNLDSGTPGFFNERHSQCLQAFADQASIAIEHHQLYEEIRRHSAELEERVKKRTTQLDQSLRRIEAILNSSNDIMILCRTDGTISQVNPAFDQMFQCNSDEAISQPLTKIVLPEHIPLLEQAFQTAISNLHPQRLEITVHCEGHTTFDADVVLSPIIEQSHSISGVVCSMRDITERKQMEEQLRRMLEREMELGELKSHYVSIAAHDLRNPLAVIQSTVNLIHQYGDRLSDAKKEEKYNSIQTSVQVMVNLLDDILTLGRVESGKLRFEPVRLDVFNFCNSIVTETKQTVGTARTINFIAHSDCSTAYLDSKLLRHILDNLLSNALKYSPENRPVTFTVECEPDQITFRVQDQGIGIPKADQKRLFETFFRASNAKKTPGTGLGLAIVKQSVDLHGGRITFESQEGIGTTVIVTLPQTKPGP